VHEDRRNPEGDEEEDEQSRTPKQNLTNEQIKTPWDANRAQESMILLCSIERVVDFAEADKWPLPPPAAETPNNGQAPEVIRFEN
jgi:hypothetical protein